MPELPEVELMTRAMDRWTRGRTLRALVVVDPAALQPGAVAAPPGQRVGGARRRAKLLLLDLGPATLVLHFRMTGKLVALGAGEGDRPGTRLRLELDGPGPPAVLFVDPRRLGQAWLLAADAVQPFVDARDLGPEPWPARHPAAWWRERLAGLRGPIKPALLRQDRVAGLGNICATEALWRAGIDPRLPVQALSAAQWAALAEAVPSVVDHVLEVEGPLHEAEGELHYVNAGGPNPFRIYGRQGQPCPRCGAPLQRIVQAGRGTWLCPACQGG